jgi:hypothetical protein
MQTAMSTLEAPMTRLVPILMIVFSSLWLTACTSAEDRAREQAMIDRADHQHCVDLGFEAETEPYGNCRLKLREIRAAQETSNDTQFGVGIGIGIGL